MHPQGVVALQGQLSAESCRVMGGTRGVWRGGAMVDSWLPRMRVRCRCVRSGVDPHANPSTSIACNRTARWRGEAMSWPYRPNGLPGRFPGIASRAGGAGLTGRNRKGGVGSISSLHTSWSTNFGGDGAFAFLAARFRSSHASGPWAFAALPRLRSSCINGPAAFSACKASSISLA